MSEPSVTPETIGAAENTAGAEGSTAQETSSGFWWETSDTPSGGPTPAEAAPAAAPGPVPYDEFRRAQTERTQFKSELEGYREYDPLLNWARENNVTPQQALQLWQSLLEHNIYVNLILPPAAPEGKSLVRCSVNAAHTPEQIKYVGDTFATLHSKI